MPDMINDIKLKEIETAYRATKSLRKTAKIAGLCYETTRKYITILGYNKSNNKYSRYKDIYNNLDLPLPRHTREYNGSIEICQEENEKKLGELEKAGIAEKRKKYSNNQNEVGLKRLMFANRISEIIGKVLDRYEKEYYRVHPNFLSRDIGILVDKFNLLTNNVPAQDNRAIIFANFGDNKDMQKLIEKIKSSRKQISPSQV